VALAATTGCGRDDPTAGLKVYRHSEDSAPNNLDPVQTANVYANIVVLNAYDTLYRYKYLTRPYELGGRVT
jgi:ABC-type oligopeptide transport system substrate-binding subunit